MKKKLNIGCGRDILKGYVNLDTVKLRGVDVVHDLNKFPYPFKNDAFTEVRCISILEHLDDLVKVMEELHRICKNKAIIKISVPYFHNVTVAADPTHKRGFTLDTFDYFTKGYHFNFYTKVRFKVIKKELIPTNIGKLVPFKRLLLNKVGIVLGGFVKSIQFRLQVEK